MTGVSMTLPQHRDAVHRRAANARVVDGMQPVHLTPSMAELLSLLLVSHPDRFVDWDALVDALWPGLTRQPDAVAQRDQGLSVAVARPGHRHRRLARHGWRIPREGRSADRALPAARLAA
jgi:DNA-binding winged helix-turn-helix (wHTH) protein